MVQRELLVPGFPLPAEMIWVPLSACTSLLKFPLFLCLAEDPGLFSQLSQYSGNRQTCLSCVPAETACSTKLLHPHIYSLLQGGDHPSHKACHGWSLHDAERVPIQMGREPFVPHEMSCSKQSSCTAPEMRPQLL